MNISMPARVWVTIAAMMMALVAFADVAEPADAPTIAPDLVAVTDVQKAGDLNGSDTDDTTAVFTFDQQVDATCCSRFRLVPARLVGDNTIVAFRIVSGQGTTALTLAFEGQVDTVARGAVAAEAVKVAGGPDTTLNPPQAEPVTDGGTTNAPDLVSVRQDGDSLLFEFDQSVGKDDDIIQNTSGLRFYRQDATIKNSQSVHSTDDPAVLRAIYENLVDVGTAVGGFVPQGTVVGADIDTDGTYEPNALDEVLVGSPIDATVCESLPVDESVLPGGWTDAPDLQFVGNFRDGPYVNGDVPSTCVDYDFDAEVYVAGDRTNFHLVPVDGGPVIDGTSRVAESEVEGDDKITVIYEGVLDPSDFARGNADGNTVTSQSDGDGPYNTPQSDAVSNNGNTDDPDLETLSVKSDSKLYFEFDEPLDQEDVVQDTAGLRFYLADTRVFTATKVYETNRDDVLVAKFDLPKGVSARDAVGGIVVQGTVVAPDDDSDGAKEANSLDEVRKSAGSINKDDVEIID